MSWFFIAILAPILFATVNHLDKFLINIFKGSDDVSSRSVGGLILYSALFGLFVSFFILIFVGKDVIIPFRDIGLLFLVGALGVFATIFYLYAMEKDEASIVAPLFQIIPVFGLIFEYLILGITPSFIQIVGSLIIVIFGVILSLEFEGFSVKRLKGSIALLMLVSSLFFSLTSIIFKFVTSSAENFWVSSFWEYLTWGVIGIALFLTIGSYRKDFLQSLRKDGKAIFSLNILGESTTTIANLLINFAVLLVPVALVYSVAALQPIFIFIFGIIITIFLPNIYKEDISKKALLQKGIPILFMILGTILILK